MAKYDKMLEARRNLSKRMVEEAKKAVLDLIEQDCKVTHYAVRKYTGFSKTFLYNNKEISDFIFANADKGGKKNYKPPKEETEEVGPATDYEFNGEKYNIYDLFFSLCEYQEKEQPESCSGCPLRDFCFKDKERAEQFWKEVYAKGHFTEVKTKKE